MKKWIDPTDWHRWFAWRPVYTGDGRRQWLKWVFRKRLFSPDNPRGYDWDGYWYWGYRDILSFTSRTAEQFKHDRKFARKHKRRQRRGK